MKNKTKTIIFLLFLLSISFLNILKNDKDISIIERRYLSQKPTLSLNSVIDKSYVDKLEEYSLDQFIFRDNFRTLKAFVNNKVFTKLDNNNLFVLDNNIYKRETKIDYKSLDNFNNKIDSIVSNLSSDNNTFMLVIPQKEYYIENNLYKNLDYNEIFNNVTYPKQIDVRDSISSTDFFKTDTHLKQESLVKVVDEILNSFNIDKVDIEYKESFIDDFYGVYYGQALANTKAERITYLSNSIIENSSVYYLEDKNKDSVYTLDNTSSLDKYDIFLNGAQAFVEIENNNSLSNRELVIFRDSFSSSLAPLLINYYSKVTLIDTRYINSDNYLKLIEFSDQDVLFIYSTHLINNSFILKD